MTPEQKDIRGLEALLTRLQGINDRLEKKYPKNDLRLAAIGLPGNALHSYVIFYGMVEYTLVHRSWWQAAYGKKELSPRDMRAVRNLESITRHSFFVFYLSRIEWTLRKLVTYMSPGECLNGNADFKQIYDHVLRKLNLKKYVALYDVCRTIRNSVHNNGHYISKKGTDLVLHWNGNNYQFEHQKPISFLTSDKWLELSGNLIDSLEEILQQPSIEAPKFIEDKIH